jgi:phosphoribosylformimino-5-aminoimidazole carboxamide ribotide isomerase
MRQPPRLYPAVDILGGQAVRLTQGDFEQDTVYASSPVDAALAWVRDGAQALHVVDLEGARSGRPVALEHLRAIAAGAGVPVQYGGGLRAIENLRDALAAGAARVVLGPAAFRNEQLLEQALADHPSQLAVAVDVRDGRVATAGWIETTDIAGVDAVGALRQKGVTQFVYTIVDRDGMLEGPGTDEVAAISDAVGDASFIYSGGIGTLDDLRSLAGLALPNLEGVIVGKALYERRFSVHEAISALAARPSRPQSRG